MRVFILLIFIRTLAEADGVSDLRPWVSEKLYKTIYGKCDGATVPGGSDLEGLLASTGNCSVSSTNFKQNVQNIQEQVYFDAAASLDVDQKSCKLSYLDQFDAAPDDSTIKVAKDTVDYMRRTGHPGLKQTPVSGKDKPAAAEEAQKLVCRQIVDSIHDIQALDARISAFDQKRTPETIDTPEITKARAARDALYKSIWNINEPEVKRFVDTQLASYAIEGENAASGLFLPYPTEWIYQQMISPKNPMSFQSIIQKMKKRTAEEIGSINATKKDYPQNYKRNLVKSGIVYDEIFKTGPSQPFYSSMQCRLESKYGKGDELTVLAVDVGLTVATLAAGGLGAGLRSAAAKEMISAQTARVLSSLAKAARTVEASAALGGLVVNNFIDKCSSINSTIEPGLCAKVESLQKSTDPLEIVRHEISSESCALAVVNDTLQLGGLIHSLGLLRFGKAAKEAEDARKAEAAAVRMADNATAIAGKEGAQPLLSTLNAGASAERREVNARMLQVAADSSKKGEFALEKLANPALEGKLLTYFRSPEELKALDSAGAKNPRGLAAILAKLSRCGKSTFRWNLFFESASAADFGCSPSELVEVANELRRFAGLDTYNIQAGEWVSVVRSGNTMSNGRVTRIVNGYAEVEVYLEDGSTSKRTYEIWQLGHPYQIKPAEKIPLEAWRMHPPGEVLKFQNAQGQVWDGVYVAEDGENVYMVFAGKTETVAIPKKYYYNFERQGYNVATDAAHVAQAAPQKMPNYLVDDVKNAQKGRVMTEQQYEHLASDDRWTSRVGKEADLPWKMDTPKDTAKAYEFWGIRPGQNGGTGTMTLKGGTDIKVQSDNEFIYMFLNRRPERPPPYKLYVSVYPDDVPAVLDDVANIAKNEGVWQMKFGGNRFAIGRPESFVIYCDTPEQCLKIGSRVGEKLKGRPVREMKYAGEVVPGRAYIGSDPPGGNNSYRGMIAKAQADAARNCRPVTESCICKSFEAFGINPFNFWPTSLSPANCH